MVECRGPKGEKDTDEGPPARTHAWPPSAGGGKGETRHRKRRMVQHKHAAVSRPGLGRIGWSVGGGGGGRRTRGGPLVA